jgi:putative transposase
VRFALIDAEKAIYPVGMMCRLLGLSPSGYYARGTRPQAPRRTQDAQILAAIREMHRGKRRSYGSPRVLEELRAKGWNVGRHRVARIMRQGGVRAKQSKRFVRTTQSQHDRPVAPNLLNRNFRPEAPNRVWAADITYIPTRHGWLYLAVVLDLFSRRVVGWCASKSLDQQLALQALKTALRTRRPKPGLIHHSDRGVQYAATSYRSLLASHGIRPSMSRTGNCWDNAVVESFFGTLKTELLDDDQPFESPESASLALFEHLEGHYNLRRRHSFLAYKSPAEYEEAFKAA